MITVAPRIDLVVSAENNHYNGWQSMLLHHSCLEHWGKTPLIVVHGDEHRLVSEFVAIKRHGGRIQREANHRIRRGVDYAPYNSAATLRAAETDSDFIVLLDPDMLLIGAPRMSRHMLRPNHLSFEAYSYLQLDEQNARWLRPVCQHAQVHWDELQNFRTLGGVPHVIATNARHELAREWFRLMDAFRVQPARNGRLREKPWLTSMWALVIAAIRLRLDTSLTRGCITNWRGSQTKPKGGRAGHWIIHYPYGDSDFDKRQFMTKRDAARVWSTPLRGDSVLGLMGAAIQRAARFYDVPGAV